MKPPKKQWETRPPEHIVGIMNYILGDHGPNYQKRILKEASSLAGWRYGNKNDSSIGTVALLKDITNAVNADDEELSETMRTELKRHQEELLWIARMISIIDNQDFSDEDLANQTAPYLFDLLQEEGGKDTDTTHLQDELKDIIHTMREKYRDTFKQN